MLKFTSLFSLRKHKPKVEKVFIEDDVIEDIPASMITFHEDEYFWPHHGNTKEDYQEYCTKCTKGDVVIYDELPQVYIDEVSNIGIINDGRHRVKAAQISGLKIRVHITGRYKEIMNEFS